MKRAVLFALLSAITALPAAGQTVRDAAATSAALARIPVAAAENKVPADAKPLLSKLRRQIRDLIRQTLDAAGADAPVQTLATALRSRLEEGGLPVKRREDVRYGSLDAVTVDRPAGLPYTVAATVTLGVPCGEDTSLYLFKRTDSGWKLLLEDEAAPYDDINGAAGRYSFALAAPDRSGAFFVASASVGPACGSSGWRSLRLRILRPGNDPEKPVVVTQKREDAYAPVGASAFQLTVDRGVATLAFKGRSLDESRVTRGRITAYAVDGNRVRRVAPLATTPESFAEEWIAFLWMNEATLWSAPKGGSDLYHWHAVLHEAFSYKFRDPPAEQGGTGPWRIRLTLNDLEKSAPRHVTVEVGERGGSYVMERVTEE